MNKYVRRMLDVYENIARTYEYRLETFDEIVEEYVAKKIQNGNLSKFIVYECGERYGNNSAITLDEYSLGKHIHNGESFTVYGYVVEDYWSWVNFFLVVSDDGEKYIFGDYEHIIYSNDKKFFDVFSEIAVVETWDYHDL